MGRDERLEHIREWFYGNLENIYKGKAVIMSQLIEFLVLMYIYIYLP